MAKTPNGTEKIMKMETAPIAAESGTSAPQTRPGAMPDAGGSATGATGATGATPEKMTRMTEDFIEIESEMVDVPEARDWVEDVYIDSTLRLKMRAAMPAMTR
jgi:hypothetical protein